MLQIHSVMKSMMDNTDLLVTIMTSSEMLAISLMVR